MEHRSAPLRPSERIDDLFALTLVDGLPVESGTTTIRYKLVRLRETGVGHERAAVRQPERVVVVGRAPKLLVSEADFRLALTAQHIEAFERDGNKIPAALIGLATVAKLSAHDMGLIESREMLITLAAAVRYGQMPQAEFDRIMAGGAPAEEAPAPQPVGQAADVGAGAAPAPAWRRTAR